MLPQLRWLFIPALALQATALSLKGPKFAVTSAKASIVRAETIELEAPLTTVTVGKTENLRVSFTVLGDDGNPVRPHQAFLRMVDEKSGEEGIQPVKVGKDGKGKVEISISRPPVSLPPTTENPLSVSLILGSFTHSPRTVPLFNLRLPPSAPVTPHAQEKHYAPQPLIAHKFNPEPSQPPKVVSATFAAAALAPWLVLAGLLSQISTPLDTSSKALSYTAPFLSLLFALEGLLFVYWVKLRLFQVLTYGVILAALAAGAGKRALVWKSTATK
ncbi:oligosaccharyl transferase delta subunit [Rhizoctonia solani AG-1 IB]|uniref:Ribophorin II n=1 Tax=Thanatephorus cucumeris (strain AG1-IB / isolate 7/3/14) TaxID=1108050 RepID=M5BJ81_THACB|nr:oligosaccharyltransferase complex subunit delta (ribophorin II) [Rhizoctonia solani AG-1 IB]CEL57464.1 oligosaccharyl transferase delta subunit [Rhizoctonia solani AG-1 IB]